MFSVDESRFYEVNEKSNFSVPSGQVHLAKAKERSVSQRQNVFFFFTKILPNTRH